MQRNQLVQQGGTRLGDELVRGSLLPLLSIEPRAYCFGTWGQGAARRVEAGARAGGLQRTGEDVRRVRATG